jgi:hypothetical protein
MSQLSQNVAGRYQGRGDTLGHHLAILDLAGDADADEFINGVIDHQFPILNAQCSIKASRGGANSGIEDFLDLQSLLSDRSHALGGDNSSVINQASPVVRFPCFLVSDAHFMSKVPFAFRRKCFFDIGSD